MNDDAPHALIPAPSHDVVVSERAGPDGTAPQQQSRREIPPPPRRLIALYVLVPVLLVLLVGAVLHFRTFEAAQGTQRAQRDFVPQVRVATAQRQDQPVELTLPGQTEAFNTANLYPRATGYVGQRYVDIGSRVHKGDLLARILSPDLDQQLLQAQAMIGQYGAALLQARAQLKSSQFASKLAAVNSKRDSTLAGMGFQTQQNADASRTNNSVQTQSVSSSLAGIAVADANLKAQQATVQRLQALQGFERVTAPFDGVITARNIETGDLLTSDSAGGTPMFSIARDDILRIAVYVPQDSAAGMRDGLAARVSVPEMPGHVFDGRVARSADALQAASRTMLTEVDVPNPDGALRSGLYVQVTFDIPRSAPGVVVPDESLVFNADGLQVAVMDQDGTVHFHKVSIYRDLGTTAELRDGLNGGEKLVLSPPVELHDGAKVTVAPPPKPQDSQKAR